MFKEKLDLVPNLPGSYQMKNDLGIIIYVGKAKNLKKRLKSYFNGRVFGKTKKLVSEIVDFEYIVTNSEVEAFILELNLIKKYSPKYNILLKDDKSYPYIEYVKKPYPALKVSRYLKIKKRTDKLLFGPYPNVYAARRIVRLINRLYPLKKCDSGRDLCLYYHINECLGYCTKNTDIKALNQMEQEILEFLKGNDDLIKTKIKEKINYYSEKLNYELAKELKEELDYIEYITTKQRVEIINVKNADFINYYFDKGHISIEFLFIRNSKILGGYNEIVPIVDNERDDLDVFIASFYLRHEIPNIIYVNNNLDSKLLTEVINTKVTTSYKGEKKKILDMAYLNAKIALENKLELIAKDESETEAANEELMNILGLNVLNRIDAFDNSSIFGSYAVSGMVVFKNGKPSKNDYRKYKISFDKNDDYNMMKEVLYRRYYKALLEKTELPELIIVDGGINQINAALNVINDLHLNIKVCGLKKNEYHRTNELIDGNTLEILSLKNDSKAFLYLTRIQDEVHRFTINYHKTLRSKGALKSELDNIAGIGKARKKLLMHEFKTYNKLKEASLSMLQELLPNKTAQDLYENLHKED